MHRKFKAALAAHNIIVVYGESRQGKTWTINKYCPDQKRIGCTATMNVDQIKKEMLHAIGVEPYMVEHTITQQIKTGVKSATSVGLDLLGKAGIDAETTDSHEETIKTIYPTVDFSIDANFIQRLRDESEGSFFVFDNFHYLEPTVQKQFCSLLKEFNYHNIKIIIVGVWKDSSKITALAPDLINRCEHIDVGSWSHSELDDIVRQGENALNIQIDEDAIDIFKRCCAHNIGIFKTFLYKYCSLEELENKKWTRKECALAIGISEAMLSKYARGKVKKISRERLEAICEYFSTTPHYLFGLSSHYKNVLEIDRFGNIVYKKDGTRSELRQEFISYPILAEDAVNRYEALYKEHPSMFWSIHHLINAPEAKRKKVEIILEQLADF